MATGYTPYMLMHGREAVMPIDVLLKNRDELPESVKEFHEHFVMTLCLVYENVHHNLEYKQWVQSGKCKGKVPLPVYQEDSWVMLYNPRPLRDSTALETMKWTGPHRVVKITNGGLTYEIEEVGSKQQQKVHVSQLKRHVQDRLFKGSKRKDEQVEEEETTAKVEESVEEKKDEELPDGVFEVEKLIRRLVIARRSKREPISIVYRVRWKGYGVEEDTNEPLEHLQDCPSQVYLFWKDNPELDRKDATSAELKLIEKGEKQWKEEND